MITLICQLYVCCVAYWRLVAIIYVCQWTRDAKAVEIKLLFGSQSALSVSQDINYEKLTTVRHGKRTSHKSSRRKYVRKRR